jgi:HSP20 family protein
MLTKKETTVARKDLRDPLAMLREMTSEIDRVWPFFRVRPAFDGPAFMPAIDVFEQDTRLVTRVDLPGMKKEDVKVELADGQLTISGHRKSEAEEKKEEFYRCERHYGSFYRTVPLPEHVKFEDVKATFAEGVLEVSVPLPAKPESQVRTVEIQEAKAPVKAA